MTTEELEAKLAGQTETQSFEIKQAQSWDVLWLAKDILAMANVRDGGSIVIGVEDETWARQGVTDAVKDTYKIDIIRDQMSPYADPLVNLIVEIVKDGDGKNYVVIRILQFEEIPVICKKDCQQAKTKTGVIYYRNSNRRVESAAVSNAHDLRDILELATVSMMRKRQAYGYTVESTASPSYLLRAEPSFTLQQELEGL